MRLIQAAAPHGRIFLSGGLGRGRRSGRGSCGGDRGLRRLGGACWRRGTLLMGDIVVITGLTGPRRDVRGLAAGPMRPDIGRETGDPAARPENRPQTKHEQDQAKPLDYHDTHFGTHGHPLGCRLLAFQLRRFRGGTVMPGKP